MSIVIGLDYGTQRIGIARANVVTRVAQPVATLPVDGGEIAKLKSLIAENEAVQAVVVGLPRNMNGQETAQSQKTRDFVAKLESACNIDVVLQDESLTSVEAESRLEERGKKYTKADIDKEAAAIILQDYLEQL